MDGSRSLLFYGIRIGFLFRAALSPRPYISHAAAPPSGAGCFLFALLLCAAGERDGLCCPLMRVATAGYPQRSIPLWPEREGLSVARLVRSLGQGERLRRSPAGRDRGRPVPGHRPGRFVAVLRRPRSTIRTQTAPPPSAVGYNRLFPSEIGKHPGTRQTPSLWPSCGPPGQLSKKGPVTTSRLNAGSPTPKHAQSAMRKAGVSLKNGGRRRNGNAQKASP